ncbi:MAG: BACON domain-containing protein [Alistipes sp.]|nr:BACON domain-containing protein [Alistipes sp.]
MRIFNPLFLYAAIMFAGLLMGCKNDPVVDDQPQGGSERVINIGDTAINIDAEGGDYTIELTVTNAIGSVAVAAKCEAEWITIGETSNTFVKFKAAYNTEESPRKATLTIKYPEAKDVVVEVTQAAMSGEPFTFEIRNVGYNKFTSIVMPQNDDNYYVLYMSKVSYFQDMGITDEETLFTDDYNFFSQYATAYGYSIQEFMTQFGLAFKGYMAMEWTALSPAEDYAVYVYGVKFNEDGSDYTVTTPVFYELVSTPINSFGIQHFDIDIDVDGPDATISINPGGESDYYQTMIVDADSELYLAEGAVVDEEYAVLVSKNWMSYVNSYMGYYDMSLLEVLTEKCKMGKQTWTEPLIANRDYMLIVFKVDAISDLPMLSTIPVVKNFSTGDVAATDMSFDIEVNACYTSVLDITITPSSTEPFTFMSIKKSKVEEYTTDEEIMNYLIDGYWLEEYSGPCGYHNSSLSPDTEYSIFVFGYHGGVATTGLTRLDVKTEPVAPAVNSVTGIVTYGPYDPVEVAALDPSMSYYESYAGYFLMLHWIEIENEQHEGVYHYIYDTTTVEACGDEWVYEDLIAYSYSPLMIDAGAYGTEYVIAGVVQDYRGNYSDMVYSEPFTYSADQMRDAQEFIDIFYGNTRSGNVQVSLVGRNKIEALPAAK